jgi:hypothetical protein
MKTTTKSQINPIHRDLLILVTIALFLAIGVVTGGIILINQL